MSSLQPKPQKEQKGGQASIEFHGLRGRLFCMLERQSWIGPVAWLAIVAGA